MDSGHESARRRGIQSVEIGLRVLDALAEMSGPNNLGAIAVASGLSPSQTHRYLASLVASGMARQDAASGKYDLGPAALKLGLGALARIDAFKVADAAISDFAQQTGRTVQVAAFGPLGPTIIRWFVGRPPVMTSFNVGSVLPVLHSATGQAFLAFLPPVETEPLVAGELRASPMDRKGVERLRGEVRSAGYAHVEGAMVPGLRATAFPIFDLQGRAILTATALGLGSDASADEKATTEALGALCRDVSRQLGWQD